MDDITSLDLARRRISELESDITSLEQQRIQDAERRGQLHAAELLACAVDLAGGQDTRTELDIALDLVREKAEQVGLLRRRPPHVVE